MRNLRKSSHGKLSALSSQWSVGSDQEAVGLVALEAIAKDQDSLSCHSEHREESRMFMELRSFTSFGMTKNSSENNPQKREDHG
jgi:hypothetical protein